MQQGKTNKTWKMIFFFWNTYYNYTSKFGTRPTEVAFHQQLRYEQVWIPHILRTSSWDVTKLVNFIYSQQLTNIATVL